MVSPSYLYHCNNDKMILPNSDWQWKISSKTRWSTGISPPRMCWPPKPWPWKRNQFMVRVWNIFVQVLAQMPSLV